MINGTSFIPVSQGGIPYKVALANLPVSTAVQDAIDAIANDGNATEASTVNTGCLNVNPYFDLGLADYDGYAVLDPFGVATRSVTPLASHNTRYGLQVRNRGGNVIGTKTLPALTGFELRARLIYRFRVFGSGVDPTKEYKFRYYLGTKCYDAEDRFIRYTDVYRNPVGCRTTFAQPVVDGDTTITIVTPDTAWYTDGTTDINHNKSFRCFKPDAFGDQIFTGKISGIPYAPWGYSVDSAYYGYLDYVDNGDGTTTVNLRYPWSFGDYAVGDGIVSTKGGGTYQYWNYGNSPAHPDVADGKWSNWIESASEWALLDGNALDHGTKFRDASAYARLLLLANYRLYEGGATATIVSGEMEYEVQYARLALEWRPVNV